MTTKLKILAFFVRANYVQLFTILFITYFLAQILRITF